MYIFVSRNFSLYSCDTTCIQTGPKVSLNGIREWYQRMVYRLISRISHGVGAKVRKEMSAENELESKCNIIRTCEG